jgi:microcystin-dependent protein
MNRDEIAKKLSGAVVARANQTIIDSTAPIGSIFMFAGQKPNPDYVFCDGRELEREKYIELFEVIGTAFGAGDGTKTFNIPTISDFAPGIRYIIRTYIVQYKAD